MMRPFLHLAFLLACCVPLKSAAQTDGSGNELPIDDRFLLAVDQGDTVMARKLILAGADVDAKTWEGATGLMFAVQNGNLPMMKLLMASGANPDKMPSNGRTALITAVRSGWTDIAEFLIREGADINLADPSKMTPLMHAIATDSFYVADLLLYYDADIQLVRKDGVDALMLACYLGRFALVRELVDAGALPDRQDDEGRTAMHYAVESGCLKCIEILLAAGAPTETKTNSGYTPLSLAVAKNKFAAARTLISAGADVNSRIGNSMNPLTLALETGNDSLAAMLRNNQATAIRRPWFNRYTFGGRVLFSSNELFTGFTTGISDRKYNLSVTLGYAFRPGAIRVLEPASGGNYYQYWERRNLYSFAAEKAFLFREGKNGYRVGISAGISGIMTYGRYRGTSLRPEVQYLVSPAAGFILQNSYLRLHLDYVWMNLHQQEMAASRCNFGVELLINRKRGNVQFKPVSGL
jgi:ankyrin repeat protein